MIPGDPQRSRDFLYVDDLVPALERIAADSRWNEVLTLASGVSTPLLHAAELVRDAAGSSAPIETPGGNLPAGENESYGIDPGVPRLDCDARPLEEAVQLYVDWLSRHPAAQGRTRA
jgi:nucleoside-diphosphate-sugar epimerase